jgi:hypothetical protein
VSEVTAETPKTLRNFCHSFREKHSAKWPPDEHELAMEFVQYFGLPPLPRMDDFKGLATHLAIEVSEAPLPDGLRGYNNRYEGRDLIVLEKLEGPAQHIGISEHTFLHELRELIEYEFCREGHPTAKGQELEERAESFAKSVRILAPLPFLSDWAGDIVQGSSPWRYLGVGLLIGFGLFHALTCFLLPHHEDYFRKFK